MKRKNLVCVAFFFAMLTALLFCGNVAGQSFPSTSVLDNFNRANENPIAGIWSNGVTGTGQCEVVSNEARGSSGTDDCYVTATYGASQEAFLTLATGGTFTEDTNFFLFACLQDNIGTGTVDGYGVRIRRVTAANDIIQLITLTNASTSNMTNSTAYQSVEFANGDDVGIRIETGGTITLYFNDGGAGWTQVDQVTGETTYSCAGTNIGFRAHNTSVLYDDFGGGTVSAGGGNNNLLGIPPIFFD